MRCRLCDENSLEELINFGSQPIVHKLSHLQGAPAGRFPFVLGSCQRCGFMQLLYPIDPSILYENYFTISTWKSQPHVPRLIDVMQSLTGMNGESDVLEIGCNDGSFLDFMKSRGFGRLYGIEPSLDAFSLSLKKGHNVIHDFFNNNSAKMHYGPSSMDLVITRQVLEHIFDLKGFFLGIDYVLKGDGMLVIEIPDSEWNLDYFDYSLWEEHINYFTLNTLRLLLSKFDFNIIHVENTLFSGKALTVFAERSVRKRYDFNFINTDTIKVREYGKMWPRYKNEWKSYLGSIPYPVAVYGCGARSSTFVNFLGIGDELDCYIDDQVEKQGYFVPGSNLSIQGWSGEKFKDHFLLLGVNTENEYKVLNMRNLKPNKYCSILPPSRNLPEFWKNSILI